jgi:hypothetical protein
VRRYLRSPQAATDPEQQREDQVRSLFDAYASVVFGPDVPAAFQLVADHLAELTLREFNQQRDQGSSSGVGS